MTPDQFTNKEFFIEVGNGHQLYVYDWGNPKGLPIIFLHGGPGSQIKDGKKALFDPRKHHVVFFDQRGCGKSLPSGGLDHNTTPDLIHDISLIADQVKFKQFVLYGSSWGSCLALAYAIAQPKRVKSMVLASIYTGTRFENDWVGKGQFRTHYPEVWERYLGRTPKAYHEDPSSYHYKNVLGDNEQLAASSALAVEELEHGIMALGDPGPALDPSTFDPTSARIYTHYMSNNCFMEEGHILKNAPKLSMPIWLVHGRFDMCCPPISAYDLNKKLPNSNLIWAISNHSAEHENFSLLRTILLQLAEKG
jgi:proline iminopeptidase